MAPVTDEGMHSGFKGIQVRAEIVQCGNGKVVVLMAELFDDREAGTGFRIEASGFSIATVELVARNLKYGYDGIDVLQMARAEERSGVDVIADDVLGGLRVYTSSSSSNSTLASLKADFAREVPFRALPYWRSAGSLTRQGENKPQCSEVLND
uniref:PDZ domain-containing protein n=1 Tax=Panagrellus redivivus TaxID=6233 RepID=A0A7E4UNY8_PANRE